MKDLFKSIFIVVVVIVVLLSAVKIKMWQCEELFPTASTLACVTFR